MFKITLYDSCCSPIADGTAYWYVDNLEEFERNWLPLQVNHSVESIERYYRSKSGEFVSDYYDSGDPDLNIVQKVDVEVLETKDFIYKDKKVTLKNLYDCTSVFEFDSLEIRLMLIKVDTPLYSDIELVGQYKIAGCKRVGHFYNRWYDKECRYYEMGYYGNPIATYTERPISFDDLDKPDRYKDFITDDKDFYKNTSLETFAWLPIRSVEEGYQIESLSDEDIQILMRDILGEAG